jgi:dTDP-4-dehydrorhamnose reductase
MRVLITGASGQLGQALLASAPAQLAGQPLQLLPLGRAELDLADAAACRAAVRQHRPHWLINAGAYTAVDRAEQDPELAMAVNAAAPAALAAALAELPHAAASPPRLLQISTDFVFNGQQGSPYRPDQPVAPLGVYGASKAEGERGVLEQLGFTGRAHVLRTSWLYGPLGHNFCLTMLRLHRQRAEAGHPLPVVADQVGCPTSTTGLAAACWQVLRHGGPPLPPILHWSDAGVASWYDFAMAIGELGLGEGLLEQVAEVLPVPTAAYPTPACRPSYSLLDCTASREALGLPGQHWRQALAAVLADLKRRQAAAQDPQQP